MYVLEKRSEDIHLYHSSYAQHLANAEDLDLTLKAPQRNSAFCLMRVTVPHSTNDKSWNSGHGIPLLKKQQYLLALFRELFHEHDK